MDILMVTNSYPPARNGVAGWTASMVRGLRARGHRAEVLTFAHDRRPPGGEGIHELPAWFGAESDFKVAPVLGGLPAAVEQRDWDVVHLHHPVFLGKAGLSFAKRRGIPCVFTCHSRYTDYLDEYYFGLARPLKPLLARRVAVFADGCDVTFVQSTAIARWLGDAGATGRTETIDIPADTVRVPPMERAEARCALGIEPERPLALYVGRITEEKRVELLVREFARAVAHVPSATLALAGAGGRERAVRELAARLGIAERVELLGGLDGGPLGMWYSASDIVVSASPSEGGPLTVVEAMQCGTPSVSYRAPGFEDRVTDGVNGLLAEATPGCLGEAMAKVLADPALRARMSSGALSEAPRHTFGPVMERIMEVYEELGR